MEVKIERGSFQDDEVFRCCKLVGSEVVEVGEGRVISIKTHTMN
jgi:hypothetical protein